MTNTATIENAGLKKFLEIKNDKIVSCKIYNKLSGLTLEAKDGSEEFIVCFKNGILAKKEIKASELKITETEKLYENDIEKFIISFKPFKVRDSKVALKLVYSYREDSYVMKKHIELSMEKRGNKPVILDYIDFESLAFDDSLNNWCIPKQSDSHVPGYALEMGQPLYVDSLFFGIEFPAALNKIKENVTSLRYYSGKKLTDIMENNLYISHKAVIGSADGKTFPQVQRAFFEYIKTISKPIRLRRQYNSWYDHMLNITRENVYGSFLEIEKAMTNVGEKPLDCYVADDGWNDYSKGFWSFNEKFPDELYPFSSLAGALSSNFGLWLGPRGGYTNDTIKFAKHIEKAGNGFVNKNSRDICVASDKYIAKTSELMLDFQKRFDLNYWKLDGFAQRPCKDKKHDHMTGGYSYMYYYSEVWEKWTGVFDKLYENSKGNYWINLTCYAPPSPWFLMHVSSLWMQISDDVGFIGKKAQVSDKDRMLSYRDEKYLDFYNVRQFQFPQRALYNHDPIYGNEAKVEMNDEDFREYLFTMAMRGTCFWELYYSYNMMNQAKWRINYSVLRFLEDNIDVLANSVIFGGRPSKSKVYGFSAFAENEGILCLRNSSDKATDYTVRLDEAIGVKKSLIYAPSVQILPYCTKGIGDVYSYGDTVNISLEPYETKIIHFGRKTKELTAEYVNVINKNTVQVTFNQSVNIGCIKCQNNSIEKARLLEDYMTAELVFEKAFDNVNSLEIDQIKDLTGNSFHTNITFGCYDNFVVTDGLYAKDPFSVKATLDGEEECLLMSQGEDVSLKIAQDKHVYFKVGNVTLKSASGVSDKVQVMAVREKTGALKLYLDGVLDSGIYAGLHFIEHSKATVYNEGKVSIYNKAFSYDEV